MYQNYDVNINECMSKLTQTGVAVIPNILFKQECDDLINQTWDLLYNLTRQLDKPIMKTDELSYRTIYELYPLHSMLIQHFGVGHSQFVWNVRQNPKVVDVFSKLWKVKSEKLLVSFDGLSVHMPPETTKRGWYKQNEWLHTDQSFRKTGLHCIQGMISLYDVNEEDATLQILEKSNIYHEEFGNTISEKSVKDWYKLSSPEVNWYTQKGCQVKRVICSAGSMILWDSRTMHQGVEPIQTRKYPNFRTVVYVCMTPRNLASTYQIKKKQKAFIDKRMTSHWPHHIKLFPKNPHTYGKSVPSIPVLPDPNLTNLGKKLSGF